MHNDAVLKIAAKPFLSARKQHTMILNLILQLISICFYIPLLILQYIFDTVVLSSTIKRVTPDNVNGVNITPDQVETKSSERKDKFVEAIDIIDIIHAHVNDSGKNVYKCHEHVVQTKDGYLLAIHRLINVEKKQSNKLVVYFHHGLLTSSELFVLGDCHGKNLPLLLADKGYDVWLGNNRGNKYSRKHVNLPANSNQFWNYSLDEFALFDIPDTMDYILQVTNVKNLTYIGFSQGSAQAIAALSLNPRLNKSINLFVGLSPAMVPKGINNVIFNTFVGAAPSLLFKIFGKRAILPSVVFWQKLMGPYYYKKVVDKSLKSLFNWDLLNISEAQKQVSYPHLFSPTSVKSVVHWFQIITRHRFQMYDEGGNSTLTTFSSTGTKNHRVAPFPVQSITTPSLLIYGEKDMLIDIDFTKKSLDSCSSLQIIGIEGFEHMDVLWADKVQSLVFEPIIEKILDVKRNELFLDDSDKDTLI